MGKTALVRAIVDGLGPHQNIVNSPTFVLIQEYAGTLPIVHIDAYRLADADEFCALGGDELMASENVCLIEWADRVCDVLPNDRLNVMISHRGPQSRRFRFEAAGSVSRSLLVALTDAIDGSDLQRIT